MLTIFLNLLQDGLHEFFYQPIVTTKSVFQSDKLQQFNEQWKLSPVSALFQQPDKMARFVIGGFVFLLLLFFTYLRMSGECKNGGVSGGGGFKSKFSIYRDCWWNGGSGRWMYSFNSTLYGTSVE